MKRHNYILALLCAAMLALFTGANAQISDFTTDSVYFSQSLNVINRYVSEPDCIEEFDYVVGNNELIVFGLRTINMGQHDAGIVDAIDTTGLFWDDCHYHWHLDGWNDVFLLDGCGNVVKEGGKVGWNLRDGGNVFEYIDRTVQGSQFEAWISQYGALDYGLISHPPNDEFNGDTRMGISAGWYDTYTESTWGNSIRSDSVPNGVYTLRCRGNFSRYFRQGLNVFPDSFDITVTISGTAPARTIITGGQLPDCCPTPVCYCDNAGIMPQVPQNVVFDAATKTGTFSTVDTPCHFFYTCWYGWKKGRNITWRGHHDGYTATNSFTDTQLKSGDDFQSDAFQFLSNLGVRINDNNNGNGSRNNNGVAVAAYTVSAVNSYYDHSLRSAESALSTPFQP